MFFVVVSHYQSLQIVILLLQACLLGSLRERKRCFINSVPVEKMVWRPFCTLIFAVWDRVCIVPISIFDPNGHKVELVFNCIFRLNGLL